MALALAIDTVEQRYEHLLAHSQGELIDDTLARMLASWSFSIGAMPAWFGLEESEFMLMMARHFPGFPVRSIISSGKPVNPQRLDEADDLLRLLIENRSGLNDSELLMAKILIAGCMGDDHLWQDLGLWNRADLSRLMHDNFAPLAERNDKDMKWKKFLYKQLCEAEGIYVCRAPSCGVCADYSDCFGPEE